MDVTAVDEAFSGDETTVTVPEDLAEEAEEADIEQGTRANPYPLSNAITQGDWTVRTNSVDLDATADLTAENMYNSAPDDGSVYILVNMTATYRGTAADGVLAVNPTMMGDKVFVAVK